VDYAHKLREETEYLEKTLAFIRNQLENEIGLLPDLKKKLIELRKDMWENTVHFTNDFTRLTEINQYLAEVNIQTANYEYLHKKIEKFKIVLNRPYFGRFDFIGDDSGDREKIYIGLSNVGDSKTNRIFVYDWRAPISSIFYRFELGKAYYTAPEAKISGEVVLKRQYKIHNASLKYFFDCNVNINDEILQEVLIRNSTAKMRNIVETIQKEQDLIIRDNENELLIVQGVAGSGKTSVALHRIAFLLYEGLNSKMSSNDILIISPNAIFNKYISSVLPELGEENVQQATFGDIVSKHINGRLKTENRHRQLEYLIATQNVAEGNLKRQCIDFKSSPAFKIILDRLISHCERNMIIFDDIYYDGKIVETRQQLKNRFLNNKIDMPMAKRLKRMENIILNKIHPLQKNRLGKIEKVVQNSEGHDFEIKSFSRLLSIKKSKVFLDRIRKFTNIDYLQLYRELFNQPGLLLKLAGGLKAPEDMGKIITMTREMLNRNFAAYEDGAPLLYLKLKIEGDLLPAVEQVVIDEAQDYGPLQYEVFKLLFRNAKYTVLGDINQGIESKERSSIYADITNIFDKKTVKFSLNKSYRSSFEINAFTQKILGKNPEFISFERHETKPVFVVKDTRAELEHAIVENAGKYFKLGYNSIAMISKTAWDARNLYDSIKDLIDIKLVDSPDEEIEKGVLIIPSYMAKGLEFDVVLAHNVSSENYSTELDRRLLYIACTRAMHRLALFYTGEKSPFI